MEIDRSIDRAQSLTCLLRVAPDPFTRTLNRKKRLLALFVGLALIGLIIGLIVAFKPEGSKAPATTVRD